MRVLSFSLQNCSFLRPGVPGGSRITMAVSSSPRNPATHHRLETQASRLHPLSPQKELSVLPPSLSPIDNLFPTGSFLQLFQEQPQPPREPLPRWRRWRVTGPLLGVIAGKLVVMAPWRLRLHSQAVPVSQDLYIIIARRGRHTEGKKKSHSLLTAISLQTKVSSSR